MLVLKMARVTNSGKPADLSAAFNEMATQYHTASQHLAIALA